jgi:hypothetical protein
MRRYQGYDELDDQPARGTGTNGNRRRRASLIGGLAVLAGFAAVAVSQRDKLNELASHYDAPFAGCLFEVNQHSVHTYPVALAAASLAVVALLLRRMTGRTRAGLPLFALLLAAGAAGTYRYEHSPRDVGTPERWVQDNVVGKVEQWLGGRSDPATPPASEVPTSAPAASPATAPADREVQADKKDTLFGL